MNDTTSGGSTFYADFFYADSISAAISGVAVGASSHMYSPASSIDFVQIQPPRDWWAPDGLASAAPVEEEEPEPKTAPIYEFDAEAGF